MQVKLKPKPQMIFLSYLELSFWTFFCFFPAIAMHHQVLIFENVSCRLSRSMFHKNIFAFICNPPGMAWRCQEICWVSTGSLRVKGAPDNISLHSVFFLYIRYKYKLSYSAKMKQRTAGKRDRDYKPSFFLFQNPEALLDITFFFF